MFLLTQRSRCQRPCSALLVSPSVSSIETIGRHSDPSWDFTCRWFILEELDCLCNLTELLVSPHATVLTRTVAEHETVGLICIEQKRRENWGKKNICKHLEFPLLKSEKSLTMGEKVAKLKHWFHIWQHCPAYFATGLISSFTVIVCCVCKHNWTKWKLIFRPLSRWQSCNCSRLTHFTACLWKERHGENPLNDGEDVETRFNLTAASRSSQYEQTKTFLWAESFFNPSSRGLWALNLWPLNPGTQLERIHVCRCFGVPRGFF